MGAGTAIVASEFCQLSFTGSGSPSQVAIQFKKELASESVCFPISDVSHRTVQKGLNPDQVTDVIAYSTVKAPTSVRTCNTYLFTSPSNVDAFLELNTIPPDSKVIAIGPTTYKCLVEYGFSPVRSKASTILSMIDLA